MRLLRAVWAPGESADNRGPAMLGAATAGVGWVVARSPRTRRSRISRMLSVSVMCVRRKRWRSVSCPTVEFCAQASRIVQIVGAGSGSATSIFFSQPSAASPATQNMRPNMLLSHSWTSPDLTQRGSDSGRSLSRCAVRVILAGREILENAGTVGSVSTLSDISSGR